MCIIASFPKEIDINMEELNNCFTNNPDGAGFMYFDDKKGKVHIVKGFMTWGEFEKGISLIPENTDRIFHFRIATTGKISPECCHPFPVTDDFKEMGLTNTWTNVGVAHNGIISDFEPKERMKASYSDTMNFIKEVIYHLQKGEMLYQYPVSYLVENSINNSKLALLSAKGIKLIGNWVQSNTSQAMYSNYTYIPFTYRKFNSCTSIYDDFDTYDYDVFITKNEGSNDITQNELDKSVKKLKILGFTPQSEPVAVDENYYVLPVQSKFPFISKDYYRWGDLDVYIAYTE